MNFEFSILLKKLIVNNRTEDGILIPKRPSPILTRKTLLSMGNNEEAELCDCVPVTFELPSDYLLFVEEYRKQPGTTWIVKPARGRKGKGIFLFQKLKDLIEWKDKEANSNKEFPSPSKATSSDQAQESLPETWVTQKYIEKPYLLAGRKFDLRIYVLVTSFVPLKVWMAREGFARMSGSQYTMKSLVDNLVHLTNAALQLSEDITNQGCKWSLHKLREFLTASHGHMKINELFDHIARIIMISLRSVEHVITNSRHCFELYGYDILLDKDLNPWLLEVNASPTLTGTDEEDYRLKYNLIDDVFNILDYECRLTGQELRVGGFDLMWNDGPVAKPVPGLKRFGRLTQPSDITLNSFLGCVNDREEHLSRLRLWRDFVLSKT